MSHVPRMHSPCALTNPVEGTVAWSPVKSLWFSVMLLGAIFFGPKTWSWDVSVMSCLLTMFTLCTGHSVGFHRLLIHRSFKCPRWLEYTLVTIGTLVGMGGPAKMLYLHDIRDWSQRHPACHPFFIHQSSLLRDWWWNLHCEIRLTHPPEFRPDTAVTESRYYRFLDQTWMLLQLPLAAVLYSLGGWAFVVWGICVRIPVSLTGHWLVGYLAHNVGPRTWYLEGHAVQGYNVPGFGLLSMGEAWHNNHHAFPESARFGIERGQSDPGWWFLCGLKRLGLVWDLNQPKDLPQRPELRLLVR
jgi:fatty-acid desaturase